MTDDRTKTLALLMRLSPGVLRELKRLSQFGYPNTRKEGQEKNPRPVPSTFKESLDAAKLRLEATKIWSTIRWGTKAHGPLEADEETQAEIELSRFRKTRKDLRQRMLREEIAAGRMTLEDANTMCELVGDEPIELQEDSGESGQEDDDQS